MNLVITESDIVSDNRIIQERDGHTAYYTLPLHARRVVLYHHGGGRGQLVIGGFKTNTVSVAGPLSILRPLLEAVL